MNARGKQRRKRCGLGARGKAAIRTLGVVVALIAALAGGGCAAPEQRVGVEAASPASVLWSLEPCAPSEAGNLVSEWSAEVTAEERSIAAEYASFGPMLGIDEFVE